MAAILPTITLEVFGIKRGHFLYSFIFSSFGVSALTGGLLVRTLQDKIGYFGMFTICFVFTSLSAFLTYKFGDMKYNYVKGMGEERMKKY